MPAVADLPKKPKLEGPLQELEIQSLTSAIQWLFAAVRTLEGSVSEVTTFLGDPDALGKGVPPELIARVDALERAEEEQRLEVVPNLRRRLDSLEPTVAAHATEHRDANAAARSRLDALETRLDTQEASLGDSNGRISELERLQQEQTAALEALTKRVDGIKIPEIPAPPPPVIVEKEEEPKEEPKIGEKPLYVGREFLDLRNQRAIQNLSKDHEGLKQELMAFRDSMKEELDRLGSTLGKTRTDFEKELKGYTSLERLQTEMKQQRDLLQSRLAEEAELRETIESGRAASVVNDMNESLRCYSEKADASLTDLGKHREYHDIRLSKIEKLFADNKDKPVKSFMSLQALSKVDLADEVGRLRGMVESMHQSLPAAVRDKVAFAAVQGQQHGVGGHNGPFSPELIKAVEETAQRCVRELADEQQKSTASVLRSYARDLGVLENKVTDVWKRLPRVVSLLDPDSATVDAAGATSATAPAGAAPDLAALVRTAWQGSWDGFKGDVEADLKKTCREVEASLQARLASLDAKVDAWTQHAPGCARSQGVAPAEASPGSRGLPRARIGAPKAMPGAGTASLPALGRAG